MGRFSFVIITLFFVFSMHAQKQFNQFNDKSGVTTVVISEQMFDLMIQFAGSSEEAKAYVELIKDLKQLNVYTTDNKSISSEMKEAANLYVEEVGLSQLMKSSAEDAQVVVYTKEDGGSIIELLMYVYDINKVNNYSSPEDTPEAIVVLLKGVIDLENVGKLVEELNITGGEHLNKIKK